MKQLAAAALYRVLGGYFCVEVKNRKKATVRVLPSLADVLSLDLPIELDPHERTKGSFGPDRRLIASAQSQRLVVIDAEQAMIHVHPMKVRASVNAMGASGAVMNSLFANAGGTWAYDLQLGAEVRAKLEDAPQGMELAGGQLRWKVPASAEKRVYEILVSLKTASGAEDYRVVKLVVQ